MYYADFLAKYCLATASKNENDFQLESLDELVNKENSLPRNVTLWPSKEKLLLCNGKFVRQYQVPNQMWHSEANARHLFLFYPFKKEADLNATTSERC